MEKFTELHVGKNKISITDANYLVSAYKVSDTKYTKITVPVERHIFVDLDLKLTSLRDGLIVRSIIYKASVGDYAMSYDSIDKARKGIKHLEDQHIASIFGARP